MKNIKAVIVSIFTPLTLIFILAFLLLSLIFAPIIAVGEVVGHAKEDINSFLNSIHNVFILRGWCSDNECYQKEEEDYWLRVKEINNKYEASPYNLELNFPLIQATIFYEFDYDKLLNPKAVDFSNSDKNATPGQLDYRAAKNQIYDLINHLVYQDSKGIYYQDFKKYDDYLRDSYVKNNFANLLTTMTIEDIIKDIHQRAGLGYYTEVVKDDISGDILDLLDAPYRDTECSVTSGFDDLRNGKPHNAVDVVGMTSKNIYSVADGTVVAVETHTENLYKYWDSNRNMCMCGGTSCLNGYGTYIIVEHNLNGQRYRSRYAHLGSVLVSVGQNVYKGQQIGVEGNTGCSTGSHMHFEFYSVDGHKFDPSSIMLRCATQKAIVANCNLENVTIHLTPCEGKYFNPNYVTGDFSFKEYVMGVFVGEISPGSYNPEFMKAFAVAIQTYTLRRGGYDPNSQVINMKNGTCYQVFKPLSMTTDAGRRNIEAAYSAMVGYVMMKDDKLMSGSYKANEGDGCGYQKNDMCQVSGNNLGKEGKTYQEILNYYYVNPTITNYCQNAADKYVPGVNNNKTNITCGAKNISNIDTELQKLKTRVTTAGIGTRSGVAAAARYLAIDFPNKIPYFTNDSNIRGRYYEFGFNTDTTNGWGCLVTKEGIPTTTQSYGSIYANGLSDSGFITWAFKNGGIDIGDVGSQELIAKGEPINFGDSRVSDGTVKIGDLFWDGGHVGIIIGIDDDNIYVAEEKDVKSGLVVTTHAKTENTMGYYYVLMSNVYKVEGYITNMW